MKVLEEMEMPIFEYRCNQCNCTFELLIMSADDAAPQCPTCCTIDLEKLISSGAIRPHGVPTGSGGFSEPACRPSGG